MTKKMNRISSKQWEAFRQEQREKERLAVQLKADLEALRVLRDYLLKNRRGEPSDKLRAAIDDYAGHLTGNREVLWAQNFRFVQPNTDH